MNRYDFEFEGVHFFVLLVVVLVPWLSGIYQIVKWIEALQ